MKWLPLILCVALLLGCEKRVVNESTWGYDMFPEYHDLPRGESRLKETKPAEREVESGMSRFWDKLTPWK